jgi:hypothetical protein
MNKIPAIIDNAASKMKNALIAKGKNTKLYNGM